MESKNKTLEEQINDIRNNPIELTIEDVNIEPYKLKRPTAAQYKIADFLKSKYGEDVPYPSLIMTTLNVSKAGLLLFGIFALLILDLLEFIGSYAFLIILIGGIVGGFLMLRKEIAYINNDTIIHFRSTDIFKRNYKRTQINLSDIKQVKVSHYSTKGGRNVAFKIYRKDNSFCKISMPRIENQTFINELLRKFKEKGLLK